MAPPVTARSTPAGRKLKRGHKCLLAFSLYPNLPVFEVGVKPPGMDGGDMIDTTTQHNTGRRTFTPRSLITDTDASVTCAYDPRVIEFLRLIINREGGGITAHYPNGDKISWWAVLRNAEPDELSEGGGMPTMTLTISCTNENPNTGAEEGPLLTEAAGTGT